MNPVFKFFSSLRLTVVLLAFSLVLVFFGTLDQVQWGISHTQKLYFESWIVLTPVLSLVKVLTAQMYDPALAWFRIPLPGGFALGALLLINLTCSHFRYFKASWKKSGIAILHLGVLLLLVSGFLTAYLQQESHMRLDEGGPAVNYSTSFDQQEIALIDKSAEDTDTVTAVPLALAHKQGEIDLHNGFKLKIHAAMKNAGFGLRGNLLSQYENFATQGQNMTETQFRQVNNAVASLKDPNVVALAIDGRPLLTSEGLEMRGFADRMDGILAEQPPTFTENEANLGGAVVEVIAPNGESLGSWLLSAGIGPEFPAQGFDYEGRRYDLSLRFARTYFPFTLQLKDFKHDKYPGTEIPRNFSSDVIIDNPATGENRPALIYMNHPLRYEGYTFFQSSFANQDMTSILQVVRNGSWWLPYLAVALVGVGMLVQFILSLARFLDRREKPSKPAESTAPSAVPIAPPRGKAGWIVPALFLALGVFIIYGFSEYARPSKSSFDIARFAELPVQSGGRILPLDSVARNTLRIIQGKQSVHLEGQKIGAAEWLADLNFKPDVADGYPIFRIDHPEVLGLFGWEQADKKYFSWKELQPHFQTLMEITPQIPQEAQQQTPFQKSVVKLTQALTLYNELAHSLYPGVDYAVWPEIAVPGSRALEAREAGEEFEMAALEPFILMSQLYMQLDRMATLGIAPPPPQQDGNDWMNVGQALFQTIRTGELNPAVAGYGALGDAYREGDPQAFSSALAELEGSLDEYSPMGRVAFEEFFNRMQPFYTTMIIYVLIMLLVLISWLKWPAELQRAAFWLLILAFVAHTFGLLARMYIQGRPPVTNLYSSAIFVGWGVILLGIILERIYKNGVGSFVASLIGFCSLIIAHNLAMTGDTLEMMQAVLDSNFWLATHVVIITKGYSAVFLAGTLGLVYVLMGLLSKGLDKRSAKALYGMAYGITCFGLLFSFVGTMLGGIWADQSWGRFWGWDPKENGALIIVLWGALMLHARWGGVVRERGFMLLAIGGNIVTAWSWFGTNLLGIGLHSYGFMSAAFTWLTIFWLSQLAVIGAGLIPLKHWASFREKSTESGLAKAPSGALN